MVITEDIWKPIESFHKTKASLRTSDRQTATHHHHAHSAMTQLSRVNGRAVHCAVHRTGRLGNCSAATGQGRIEGHGSGITKAAVQGFEAVLARH